MGKEQKGEQGESGTVEGEQGGEQFTCFTLNGCDPQCRLFDATIPIRNGAISQFSDEFVHHSQWQLK